MGLKRKEKLSHMLSDRSTIAYSIWSSSLPHALAVALPTALPSPPRRLAIAVAARHGSKTYINRLSRLDLYTIAFFPARRGYVDMSLPPQPLKSLISLHLGILPRILAKCPEALPFKHLASTFKDIHKVIHRNCG
jgi:hypothetical protein